VPETGATAFAPEQPLLGPPPAPATTIASSGALRSVRATGYSNQRATVQDQMSPTSSAGGPLVSVVIPTFNRAGILARALESVAAQVFTDYEVVVVDDGSTDGTAEVLTTAVPNLRLVRYSQNLGAGAARNAGISASYGKQIAFLDSDDRWEPDKLARQVAALRHAPPDVLACTTGFYLYRNQRRTIVVPQLARGQFRREIRFGCTISPGSTLLVERKAFEELGLFDESIRRLEDWDWLLRYAERYDLEAISDPLAHVYQRKNVTALTTADAGSVIHAITQIGAKHDATIRARGTTAYLQFRSSLLVELAAVFYRSGHCFHACGYVLRSLLIYPFRNRAFFRAIFRAAVMMPRDRH
jgi:glycosyltransferase involved in cell wall biosynthesis